VPQRCDAADVQLSGAWSGPCCANDLLPTQREPGTCRLSPCNICSVTNTVDRPTRLHAFHQGGLATQIAGTALIFELNASFVHKSHPSTARPTCEAARNSALHPCRVARSDAHTPASPNVVATIVPSKSDNQLIVGSSAGAQLALPLYTRTPPIY
jgi:hypothetical protein